MTQWESTQPGGFSSPTTLKLLCANYLWKMPTLSRRQFSSPQHQRRSAIAKQPDWQQQAPEDWLKVTLPDGRTGTMETNTMPQWAGSCWYYLRYLDPSNSQAPFGSEAEKYWMPVDLYVGGVEHAVLHLLYARFWHKVLFDCGLVTTREPFQKLFNQGMILAYSYQSDAGKYYHPDDVEEKDGKKNLYIEGVFLQSETQNRNGRIYPFDVLNKEVERYSEEYVKAGRALGELGHPDGPTVNLDRVSHKITSLKAEGNNFMGKARILDTPMGKIAKSLLGEGVKLGVSSRGMGSLKEENGVKYVSDDFMLATAADIVADPSAPDAFVNGIMEGKEWVWEGGLLRERQIQEMKKEINNASKVELEEKMLSAFDRFLSNL